MGGTLQPRVTLPPPQQLTRIPRCMGIMDTLKILKTHDNPRLCYPPAGFEYDPIEYLRNHKDTVSPWGRLKHAWGGIRLMWIASNDSGCSTTFGRLPVEVICIIRRFHSCRSIFGNTRVKPNSVKLHSHFFFRFRTRHLPCPNTREKRTKTMKFHWFFSEMERVHIAAW